MPLADGMTRRYEALDLTEGFVGSVEYTYVKDEEGQIVIFEDRTGIREIPAPVTKYGAIQGEIIEEQLWEQGKHAESRLRHDINNFHSLDARHVIGVCRKRLSHGTNIECRSWKG